MLCESNKRRELIVLYVLVLMSNLKTLSKVKSSSANVEWGEQAKARERESRRGRTATEEQEHPQRVEIKAKGGENTRESASGKARQGKWEGRGVGECWG